MKSSSPRELAIYISLIFTSIFIILSAAFNYFPLASFWLYLTLGSVIIFVIIYLLVFRIFSSFIIEKIQPIYKSIHHYSLSQKELRKQFNQGNLITTINKNVEDWASKQASEIEKLKQLEKYRKDFVGNVSHELKTPIFNIQGYILTLLDGGLEDDSINKLYLKRTEKSINRMISIVEDLESISRLESGEMKLSYEVFNIVQLTEEVFEALEMRAKEKGIKLVFSGGYARSIKVKADRKRIFEVINNLVINSINYGTKDGKTSVSFMDMGQNILIDISDNGIGISEKDIPRIFERFYRTDKSRSRDQGGTGLGLAIVKHVIEAHNQTINVRSRLGKGSSFVFTLEKA